MSALDPDSIERKLREIVEDEAQAHGFTMAWIEYRQRGAKTKLSVYVEKPDSDMGVEECAFFSRQLAARLDLEDVIPYTYNLEVSSPGLDRPLFKESDYVRFAGEQFKAVLVQDVDGNSSVRGKILGAENEEVTIELESGEELKLRIENIKRANLVPLLPW